MSLRCPSCGRTNLDVRPSGDVFCRDEQKIFGAKEVEQSAASIVVVTTEELPGHRIVRVHGEVFGLIVRSRNVLSDMGAQVKGVLGGEVRGYTKLLTANRHEALGRLRAEAAAVGANAVLAMRFDSSEIGDAMAEVAAYGTAVTIEPIEEQAL
jgi:uncharacterized protein YbjQ (UPF0145 family)